MIFWNFYFTTYCFAFTTFLTIRNWIVSFKKHLICLTPPNTIASKKAVKQLMGLQLGQTVNKLTKIVLTVLRTA